MIARSAALPSDADSACCRRSSKFSAPTIRWVVLFAGLADTLEDTWPAVKGPLRWLAGALFIIATVIGTRGVVRLARVIPRLGAASGAAVAGYVLGPRLRGAASTPGAADAAGGDRDGLSTSRRISRDAGASTMIALIQRLFSMVLWLSGLIVMLDHFGQNISSVIAALGVTSLAIGRPRSRRCRTSSPAWCWPWITRFASGIASS